MSLSRRTKDQKINSVVALVQETTDLVQVVEERTDTEDTEVEEMTNTVVMEEVEEVALIAMIQETRLQQKDTGTEIVTEVQEDILLTPTKDILTQGNRPRSLSKWFT